MDTGPRLFQNTGTTISFTLANVITNTFDENSYSCVNLICLVFKQKMCSFKCRNIKPNKTPIILEIELFIIWSTKMHSQLNRKRGFVTMVIRLPKYYNSRLHVTIHNSIINIRENIKNALKQLYQNASCTNLAIICRYD